MSVLNRRGFLATSSTVAGGVALGVHRAIALPIRSRQPIATFLPDVVDPDHLRRFALHAVDAARTAGASYADIRIADRRLLTMRIQMAPYVTSSSGFEYAYGIRVCVDGAWAFVYGADPSFDGVARSAQEAAAMARVLAKAGAVAGELAAAPVARGEWATPIQIDPFSVSPDDHAGVLGAYIGASTRIMDVGMAPEFAWSTETRVFASTEGSLVTQRLGQFVPDLQVDASPPLGESASLPVTPLVPTGAGFEAVLGAELQDQIKATAEEAAQLLGYPEAEVDVGRREGVFDGTSVGHMLGATIVPALELERVLGYTANDGGTSYLSPVDAVLNGPARFGRALTLTADRTPPHFGGAKWDDEGVVPDAFPLIQQGKVVDYFTTRTTAPALATAYGARGVPVKSHGCAVTASVARVPTGTASHLTMAPAPKGTGVNDLANRIGSGILVRGVREVQSDQQLLSGAASPPMVFEVRKGKVFRRLVNAGIQFTTQSLWKSLANVGDESTVHHVVINSSRGQPSVVIPQLISAPAAHIQEINVTQIGRR